MANLKTNYKNDILDTSKNVNRKYRMVDNGDGTYSFEDVTEYLQVGDTFGAGDLNNITGNLTADNGTSFDFAYNESTKEYGYKAKVEGADTFFPFSNAKALYDAIKDSGLDVTEDMTYRQLVAVLEQYFTGTMQLISNSQTTDGFNAEFLVEKSDNPNTGYYTIEATKDASKLKVNVNVIANDEKPFYASGILNVVANKKAYSKLIVNYTASSFTNNSDITASVLIDGSIENATAITGNGGKSQTIDISGYPDNTEITIDLVATAETGAYHTVSACSIEWTSLVLTN